MKGRRLTAVIGDMGPGGAQRVLTVLMNHWAAKGWQIHLLTLDNGEREPFYPLDPAIDVRALSISKPFASLLATPWQLRARVRVLRGAIVRSNPEVILSFLDVTNIITLFAAKRLGVPIIVSERTDPGGRRIRWTWDELRKLSYPWADSVVCQGEKAIGYFSKSIQRRGCIIPNPVTMAPDIVGLRADLDGPKTVYKLVTLGRLVPEKGYDVLLDAFARACADNPAWHLTFMGEGRLRSALESQAERLGISNRVHFAGLTRQPMVQLATADLFVMSSRVEGFPNALTEAMSVGLPVVATNVGAVPEIIRDGVDGIIVPKEDSASLAHILSRLMASLDDRKLLASKAPEVLQRFSIEAVSDMWEEAFDRRQNATAK